MLIEQPKKSGQLAEAAFLAKDLFGALSPAAQNALRAVRHEKEYFAGETIFAAGEMPSAIYILVQGEAQILDHGVAPAYAAQPGEIFGITETLSNLPHEISLKAIADCRFAYIRRESFLGFLRNEPAACFRLLEIVAANLQKLYRFFH